MEMTKSPSVGSFVANDFRTAAVFQKYGIDFCCKGGKSVDEVCDKKNIDREMLLRELNEVSMIPSPSANEYSSWSLDKLIDYIESTHHRYVENAIPPLLQFLDKLCNVHGGNHPELFEINEQFVAAAGELTAHMKKEELILFPYVYRMVEAINTGVDMNEAPFGTVKNPIAMMMQEHDVEGDRFSKIAELSNNYNAPADGCTTYRVAFALLKEFEEDLHKHIHLENNILFPKALEMEKKLIS
jgi:regulator of cell morphogenesis and NO signaling